MTMAGMSSLLSGGLPLPLALMHDDENVRVIDSVNYKERCSRLKHSYK